MQPIPTKTPSTALHFLPVAVAIEPPPSRAADIHIQPRRGSAKLAVRSPLRRRGGTLTVQQPRAQAINDQRVTKGQSFEQIERAIAEALPCSHAVAAAQACAATAVVRSVAIHARGQVDLPAQRCRAWSR